MEYNSNRSKDKSKDKDDVRINHIIENIKSNFILSKIYDNMSKK